MKAIQCLMQEHERILELTQIVDQVCLKILQGTLSAISDMQTLIELIHTYADRLHHAKEEKILFRAMEEHLGPLAQKLIRHGMLSEHELARYHIGCWKEAVDQFATTPTWELRYAILVHAGSWSDLLQRHAAKENAAVFPFATKMLPQEIQEAVEAESVAYDEAHVQEREKQMQILATLRTRYLPHT